MINKKSPRLGASFPIMDKNFLTSNQTYFINKNGKEKATCITKIKVNASKRGYIKNYQTFKELHVSNGYISKRKLKQTLNFLNKVVK